MKRIYLDYAATTPINKRVAKAMRDFELANFGNPSSSHREGQTTRALLDFARVTVAEFIHAKPQEVIFTSGATESNNIAIQGTIQKYLDNPKLLGNAKPHVVTTQLEHHSVYNTVKELEKRGVITTTFVKPNKFGICTAEDILSAIKKNTVLVSVIFVCNEIGTVLPVREIGKNLPAGIIYHIDAVQAAKYYNCNVEKLACHLLTLSAHKLEGPKGIGALYIKTGFKLPNITFGGSQEYGLRPGTQNMTGIIGFAEAIKNLGNLEDRERSLKHLTQLKQKLAHSLLKNKQISVNGLLNETFAPDILSLQINNVDQDSLMTLLDLKGIAASTGSACVSGSTEPSHVMTALKMPQTAAALRLSISQATTPNKIASAAKIITTTITQLLD